MTREEKLYSMRMQDLVNVADKLGIKINTKAAKSKAIETILAAEEMNKQNEKELKKEEAATVKIEEIKTTKDFLNTVADVLDGKKTINEPVKAPETVEAKETTPKAAKEPKKANLKLNELTYKGKTQSIKEWAAQINMSWPTLYDRVNRNGWPVDLAIETPLGQRRPKNK